ncbi:MAG TPA: glycosyltransferase, partial [Levilinea sp.]|nr:glycosyltransferase [Levilinea sp.]
MPEKWLMPKLLLVFSSFKVGGIERAMVNLTRRFMQSGVEVVLAVLRKEGPFINLLPASIQIIDLEARNNTFYTLPNFVRAIKRQQPDAILSAHPNINFLALWARFLTGSQARLVISEHSHLTMASNSGPRLSLRYRPLMEKFFYPMADAIVAVSGGLADDLAASTGISRQRIAVIHNPVVTEDIAALSQEPLPQPLFPPSVPVILGAGRLVDVKDFATLIRAFAEVRSHKRARLILLGEGPLRGKLESLVQHLHLIDEVDLPGEVVNPFAYMARAAVLVLSSKYEGLPNVIAESLACGTPV